MPGSDAPRGPESGPGRRAPAPAAGRREREPVGCGRAGAEPGPDVPADRAGLRRNPDRVCGANPVSESSDIRLGNDFRCARYGADHLRERCCGGGPVQWFEMSPARGPAFPAGRRCKRNPVPHNAETAV